ncbi:MAG: STAS domain-containing protein [Syntrophomonadales bacterium]
MIRISERKQDDILVLGLEGRLDASTSSTLDKHLSGSIEGGEIKMVLDFSSLDYISSAGLRVLLMAAKKIKGAGGRLVLAGLKSHVREVFDIAGFSSIFPIYSTQEDALNSF